jgi:hypothetical protein
LNEELKSEVICNKKDIDLKDKELNEIKNDYKNFKNKIDIEINE